jgi:hypothetical protein
MVCTNDGTKVLADAQAAMLQQRFAAAAPTGSSFEVKVQSAKTPRFLVRGKLLLVELGETVLDVRAAPARR